MMHVLLKSKYIHFYHLWMLPARICIIIIDMYIKYDCLKTLYKHIIIISVQ